MQIAGKYRGFVFLKLPERCDAVVPALGAFQPTRIVGLNEQPCAGSEPLLQWGESSGGAQAIKTADLIPQW